MHISFIHIINPLYLYVNVAFIILYLITLSTLLDALFLNDVKHCRVILYNIYFYDGNLQKLFGFENLNTIIYICKLYNIINLILKNVII